MKYLLIVLIFTQASGDHGAPITRDLDRYDHLRDCQNEGELMRTFYEKGAVWMEPNAEPQTIVNVRYLCKPVKP